MCQMKEGPRCEATGYQKKIHKNYTICDRKRKKLPYSKDLKEKFLQGYKPHEDIFLFIGEAAWYKARRLLNSRKVLVFPPNCDPREYTWSIAGGQSVLVYDTTSSGSGVQFIRCLVSNVN